MRLIVTLLAILLLAVMPAAAQDCNVELKQADSFKELSDKLRCMNEKIKFLERQLNPTSAPTIMPMTTSGRSLEKDGIIFNLIKCAPTVSFQGGIACEYQVSNSSKADKKVCVLRGARLVTDSGATFTSDYIMAIGGSTSAYGEPEACDVIPPGVSSKAYLTFRQAAKDVSKLVQLVRLNCGAGCILDVRNIPFE